MSSDEHSDGDNFERSWMTSIVGEYSDGPMPYCSIYPCAKSTPIRRKVQYLCTLSWPRCLQHLTSFPTDVTSISFPLQKRRGRRSSHNPKLGTKPRLRRRHRARRRRRPRGRPRINHTSHNTKLILHLLFLERPRATRQRGIPVRFREVRWRLICLCDFGWDGVVARGAHKGVDFGARGCEGGLVGGAEGAGEAAVCEAGVETDGECPA